MSRRLPDTSDAPPQDSREPRRYGGSRYSGGERSRYGGNDGRYGGGNDGRGRKRRADEPPPGRQRPLDPPVQEVQLTSNAFRVSVNPEKLKRLDIFTVKFEGPRVLGRLDENLKRYILNHKSIWRTLKCPKLAAFTDHEFAKLFVVSTREFDAVHFVNLMQGNVVRVPGGHRGQDEDWTVHFKHETENKDLSDTDPASQALWLQFASQVAGVALAAGGFTIGRGNTVLRSADQRSWQQLRDRSGYLVPGYSKSFCFTEHGTYWTFAPKYSLFLNRTMNDELRDTFRGDASLTQTGGQELTNVLRRRNLMCVTSYSPNNIYKIVGVAFDKRATDEFLIREKAPSGEFIDVKETHLGYLRKRYGAQTRELEDPTLESATMVACQLLGRRKQIVKRAKTVFIPAPLLKICCVSPKDLARSQREEITRLSQRKAHDCLREISQIVRDMDNPDVRDAFDEFGLTVQAEAESLAGKNSLRQSVVISLCPPGIDSRGNAEIYLDDSGSFQRDFISRCMHSSPPKITNFITIARTDHGNIPSRWCDLFFQGLEQHWHKWNWDVTTRWSPRDLRVIKWDGTPQELERLEASLHQEFETAGRPDLIWGLLSERDDYEYSLFKRFAYRLEVPSQVITIQTLRRLQAKAFWKMIAAVAAKVQPILVNNKPQSYSAPWHLRNAPLEGREATVAIGIATYQPVGARGSGQGGFGLVATVNSSGTGVVQDFGQSANVSSGGIFGELKQRFEKLYQDLQIRHDKKPDTLLIYRKGVSESMFSQLERSEVTQIEAALDAVVGKRQWEPSERILTLSQPKQWREKGTYEFYIPCVQVDARGERRVQQVMKTAEPISVLGPDRLKSSGHLEFRIPISDTEGVPDIHSAQSFGVKLPHGRKALLEKRPRVAFIVVNHSHTSNLLFFNKRGDKKAPAGTIVNNYFRGVSSDGKPMNEFFIIPSSGATGFAGPVHYSIITNQTTLTNPEIELISLRFCFLYYNQQGSVKTPYMLRFAEMGAEKACTLYQEELADPNKKNRLRDTHFLL
eukprot:Protomagalhaensia_sp_Gyna_25__4582@NODE_422_length_3491_cov_32_817497_g324_i0_p1_GENE_NODE_422_length_3491_cov_32_817497_g324_i0NODE_422_length_3491_cov_32_817497_g324_i0_p1_ORF_typecomplete_len1026_score168_69Piwi/PF02171_17/2_7e16Piwi/PF02171_17/4_3e14PAZ/PF02170_22/0_00058_NODE_422_length_3491_cov_32_817497_g324_i03003377